jgi:hypothetical protein
MQSYYKELPIDTRRVDFLVEGISSVELMAVIVLESAH